MAKQFTLGKKERLKSRKQTELLFRVGKKFSLPLFRIHYAFSKMEQPSLHPAVLQFGAGVSKRNFKKAVDRNRIKRLIREAYRLQKKMLQDLLKEKNHRLNVFFIYTGRELPAYKELYEKTGKGIEKLRALFPEII